MWPTWSRRQASEISSGSPSVGTGLNQGTPRQRPHQNPGVGIPWQRFCPHYRNVRQPGHHCPGATGPKGGGSDPGLVCPDGQRAPKVGKAAPGPRRPRTLPEAALGAPGHRTPAPLQCWCWKADRSLRDAVSCSACQGPGGLWNPPSAPPAQTLPVHTRGLLWKATHEVLANILQACSRAPSHPILASILHGETPLDGRGK